MKKNVIIIFGCGFFQKKIIKNLENYKVVGIDENPNAYCKNRVDYFINEKFENIKNIEKKITKKKHKPFLIISYNTEAGYKYATKLKKLFKHKTISKKTYNIFFDKSKLNQFLKNSKFNYPKQINLSKNFSNIKKFSKQIIIKPAKSSGSRNIILINKKNIKNFVKSCDFKKNLILQEYLGNNEIVTDGIVQNKQIKYIVFSKKIKVQNLKTVSQTIYYKNDMFNQKVRNFFYKAINQFLLKSGYRDGLFHIEFILKNKKIFIIDAAPRGPGFFVIENYLSKIVKKNLIIEALKVEIGEEIRKNFSYSKYGHMIHFILTKKGKFLKFFSKKLSNKFKLEKFNMINSFTNKPKIDNDRLGSIYFKRRSIKDLMIALSKIKKIKLVKYSNDQIY